MLLLLCGSLLWRAGVEGLCFAPRPLAPHFPAACRPHRRDGLRGERCCPAPAAGWALLGGPPAMIQISCRPMMATTEQEARRRRWRTNEPGARGFGSATTVRVPGGMEARALRLKQMLEAEDFASAAQESDGRGPRRAVPDLAEVARMRGRALLDPLLDQMIDGAVLNKLDFEQAYEAFRLAAHRPAKHGRGTRGAQADRGAV